MEFVRDAQVAVRWKKVESTHVDLVTNKSRLAEGTNQDPYNTKVTRISRAQCAVTEVSVSFLEKKLKEKNSKKILLVRK